MQAILAASSLLFTHAVSPPPSFAIDPTIELIRMYSIDMGRLLLDDDDAAAIVEEELNAPRPFFSGLSILEAAESGQWCIYIGLTSRTLEIECLRWLSQRGANHAEDYVGPITKIHLVQQLVEPRLTRADDRGASQGTGLQVRAHLRRQPAPQHEPHR